MRGLTVLVAATIVSLAACRTIETKLPPVELPETTVQSLPDVERWWTQFNDPQLNALIEEAFAANLDLSVAMARIEEARAGLGVARSFLYPTVDAYANADRSRRSNATDLSFPGPLYTNIYGVGLQVAYEVDLSGRVAAGVSAAESTLLATRYNTEAVRTVLAAQVATTYFTLLSLDAELQISRDTLVTRDDAVGLQRQRYDAGLISEYDLKLAQAERASVAASVPPLQRARAQTEAALATLAGRSARAVFTPMIARAGLVRSSDSARGAGRAAVGRAGAAARHQAVRGATRVGERPRGRSARPVFPIAAADRLLRQRELGLVEPLLRPGCHLVDRGESTAAHLYRRADFGAGRWRQGAPAAARTAVRADRAIGVS